MNSSNKTKAGRDDWTAKYWNPLDRAGYDISKKRFLQLRSRLWRCITIKSIVRRF